MDPPQRAGHFAFARGAPAGARRRLRRLPHHHLRVGGLAAAHQPQRRGRGPGDQPRAGPPAARRRPLRARRLRARRLPAAACARVQRAAPVRRRGSPRRVAHRHLQARPRRSLHRGHLRRARPPQHLGTSRRHRPPNPHPVLGPIRRHHPQRPRRTPTQGAHPPQRPRRAHPRLSSRRRLRLGTRRRLGAARPPGWPFYTSSWEPHGPRVRWRHAREALARDWPITPVRRRLSDNTVTVDWAAVAPKGESLH